MGTPSQDFCFERVNCWNTRQEFAGFIAVIGWPDCFFSTYLTQPLTSNLPRMHKVVTCVGGFVWNSFHHWHWTSLMFSYLMYHFKTAFLSSNVNLVPVFNSTNKTMLIWQLSSDKTRHLCCDFWNYKLLTYQKRDVSIGKFVSYVWTVNQCIHFWTTLCFVEIMIHWV